MAMLVCQRVWGKPFRPQSLPRSFWQEAKTPGTEGTRLQRPALLLSFYSSGHGSGGEHPHLSGPFGHDPLGQGCQSHWLHGQGDEPQRAATADQWHGAPGVEEGHG